MARLLTHVETLVYWDGAQVFLAVDQFQTRYVCLLTERHDAFDLYLCVPVSQRALGDFFAGDIDLLSLVDSRETDERLLAQVAGDNLTDIVTTPMLRSEVPAEWLPDAGFVLDRKPSAEVKIVEESVGRSRAIVHCSLSPPEARTEPKITADHLAQGAKLFQRLVTHAYRRALRELDPVSREVIGSPDNYQLEVFAFSPGSFTLHMQTAAPADLFGYSHIEKALRLIDAVNEQIGDPDAALQVLSQYGGHFVTAYKNLLQFIVESQSPLEYQWTMPELRDSRSRKIRVKQASPVYELLTTHETLTVVERRLVGRVSKVDDKYGTWRLTSEEENREYRGRSGPPSILAGLTIETERYEFLCEERLEEERGTGRETTVLYLKSYTALGGQ